MRAVQELEKDLKLTCEQFIMAVTKLMIEPLLSFITKVTAVKTVSASGENPVPLRTQAFAQAAKVHEIMDKVRGTPGRQAGSDGAPPESVCPSRLRPDSMLTSS